MVYGVLGLKTHAKMLLVTRREGKRLRRYGHLSTGNYNPRTARLYTDLSLLTADPRITADMDELDAVVKDHEPVQALTDHADGLTFYRRAAEIFDQLVAPSGYLFLEIGFGQQHDVENIFQSCGYLTAAIADLAGIPRLIVVER